mmetsp:Transcript_66800/g.157623  ORF Transcript_66800/g.157623 Transcript_66800/m.157623 type:complete len:88 (-) Transcript_66800:23-286(-)
MVKARGVLELLQQKRPKPECGATSWMCVEGVATSAKVVSEQSGKDSKRSGPRRKSLLERHVKQGRFDIVRQDRASRTHVNFDSMYDE